MSKSRKDALLQTIVSESLAGWVRRQAETDGSSVARWLRLVLTELRETGQAERGDAWGACSRKGLTPRVRVP